MTRKEIMAGMAALLCTVNETEGGVPRGPAYAALQMQGFDYEGYMQIEHMLITGGWLVHRYNVLQITESGRLLCEEIYDAIPEARRS